MSVVPLPFCLCEERFRFTGFDIDPYKVENLNRGGSYIVRIPGAQIQQAQQSGFVATGDYARIAQMDVVIICVPPRIRLHCHCYRPLAI
jgi:UDP-N-acetyl-D-glucosamine dehydrogenase